MCVVMSYGLPSMQSATYRANGHCFILHRSVSIQMFGCKTVDLGIFELGSVVLSQVVLEFGF